MADGAPDLFFFDAPERALVARVRDLLMHANAKQAGELDVMLARLGILAALIRDAPSITASWDDGVRRAFSVESLVEQLCRTNDYDLDLHMPTKAIVGQAYLIAKINLLKAVGYMVVAAERGAAPSDIGREIEREIAQSIYTKLAEELFIAIVTDRDAERRVKMGAARFLYRIWEQRLVIEIDDFAPLLESAWAARARMLPVIGTLLGTSEVFRLFAEARDQRFLDYFGEDEVADEQMLAFEEFVFELSHEEIARLRANMVARGKAMISRDEAKQMLGHAEPNSARASAAATLYSSYKKRRLNALHRALTGAPGPKKTAEEYVMIAFLEAGTTMSKFGFPAATKR